jgi:FAD/FMN-containing dehydrogenase/Fe-S oxidoreductase
VSAALDSAILGDLRAQVRGELRVDPLTCSLFSHDASVLAVRPIGVFSPQDEADLKTAVQFAAERRLPLHARGAGTGLAGESLGAGLILDFTRHFRTISDVGPDTVRVQPGVVLRALNDRLASEGRRFAPDPASEVACTLGGMIATNASGPRALRYGYTRAYVRDLRCVLASGQSAELGVTPLPIVPDDRVETSLAAKLAELLAANQDLIRTCYPRTQFNRLGYLLDGLTTPNGIDLAKLLVGSEGTLALVTEATLRTVPLPVERWVLFLGFASLEMAARCAPLTLSAEPSACELLDRRSLALACEADSRYEQLVTPGVQAVLLVEFEADRPGDARRAGDDLLRRMLPLRQHGLAMAQPAETAEEAAWLWRLRDLAEPLLHSVRGAGQPVAFLEDVAVPVDHLAELIFKIQDVLRQRQVTAAFLIHAGAGQVHTRPFLDLTRSEDVDKLRHVAETVHRLVLDLGGTVSTQNGTGMARTPWVPIQYGRLHQVFRAIKGLFDPLDLLNPGKIVAEAAADPLTILRRSAKPVAAPLALRLAWPEQDLAAACNRCNSCGTCRTQTAAQRMCPIFRADPHEAASPRAKANVLRDILGGALPIEHLSSDELRAVADLCVNCKMCGLECPSKVPIPKIMLEAKAQHLAEVGFRWDDWVLSRTETLAALGSHFAWLTNHLLGSRLVRWFLARLLGISPHRQLPRFAPRSFLHQARRRGWTKPPRRQGRQKVAYFVDIYANYNDPGIAEATVAVLHHHDIEVYVPPGQTGCGMAPLAYGDVETARTMARRNLNHLADLTRSGYTIVCSEPTAALMLRQDYLDLFDENDARMVATHTTELTTYLWQLYEAGELRGNLRPFEARVGHHVPCHLKALELGIHGPKLLRLIPGMTVEVLDLSCSGMAGTFGFKESAFDTSLAAGRPMLERLARADLHFGSTECSACRLQMEHAAAKTTLHPVQYLAWSYGLAPPLPKWLYGGLHGKGRG